MTSRRNSRASTSKKDNRASQELQFCRESGETYRPFIDPVRIETNDARRASTCDARARTKGVPDAYLGILNPMIESSRGQNALVPLQRDEACGYQQRVLTLDVPTARANAPNPDFSSSYESPASCDAPSLTIPGAYHDPYPIGLLPFDFGHQYSRPSLSLPDDTTQALAFSNPAISADVPVDGLDFDDPVLFAEALEIARTMRLEDMDLDLLRLDVDHDITVKNRDVYFVAHANSCASLNAHDTVS